MCNKGAHKPHQRVQPATKGARAALSKIITNSSPSARMGAGHVPSPRNWTIRSTIRAITEVFRTISTTAMATATATATIAASTSSHQSRSLLWNLVALAATIRASSTIASLPNREHCWVSVVPTTMHPHLQLTEIVMWLHHHPLRLYSSSSSIVCKVLKRLHNVQAMISMECVSSSRHKMYVIIPQCHRMATATLITQRAIRIHYTLPIKTTSPHKIVNRVSIPIRIMAMEAVRAAFSMA
jgi:hypothetical protein